MSASSAVSASAPSFNLLQDVVAGVSSDGHQRRAWSASEGSGRVCKPWRERSSARVVRSYHILRRSFIGLQADQRRPELTGLKRLQLRASEGMESSSSNQEVINIANKENEKLAGVLKGPPDGDVVILCHGFLSSKQSSTLQAIVPGLAGAGFGVLRFDFSGNGESGGEFEFGNYWKEVEDLRSVVGFVREVKKRSVKAIVGHSKGGDVVILYAAKYGDVPVVVNVSGRFDLSRGLEERFGKEGLAAIAKDGYWDVKDAQGAVKYRVTKKSLEERLSISIEKAARTIDKNVSVLTVHGTADETIPVEDGKSFDTVVANHALALIEGADHRYSRHREMLQEVVNRFIKSDC